MGDHNDAYGKLHQPEPSVFDRKRLFMTSKDPVSMQYFKHFGQSSHFQQTRESQRRVVLSCDQKRQYIVWDDGDEIKDEPAFQVLDSSCALIKINIPRRQTPSTTKVDPNIYDEEQISESIENKQSQPRSNIGKFAVDES